MSDQNYNSESIKVLTDIEHIRLRPGMYVGDMDNPIQLFSEILDNAVDELQGGYGAKIKIVVDTYHNRYTIRDYGRGIPHGEKILSNGDKKETLEILLTKSNSGGKFDNLSYKHSCGLHGVGLTVTNALSRRIVVTSHRDGESVEVSCDNGEVLKVTKISQYEEDGTEVTFEPDPKFFDSDLIPESYIINRCKILKAFGYNIEYYKNDELQEFNVNDIFDLLPKCDISYGRTDITYTSDNEEIIRVALDYTSNTNYGSYGYTNLIYNRYGGTHTRLIQRAICDVWSEFYKEVSTELKWDDCTLGLNVLVAVFIGDISFSSQTKEKLTVPNKNLEDLMSGFKSSFKEYLVNNPELRKGLLKRFEEYRISQNKLLSQKEIMNVIKINDATNGKPIRRRSVVPGLIECTSTSRDGTEIYFVEGNSAAGPVARARNRKYQSVLPLRGKIKNVTYMDIKDALKYETVRNIINAVGAGVGPDADSSTSRYEKIIILTDADPDGEHIAALILSTLVNLTPNLVKDGLVYIVLAPLYGCTYNGERRYYYDYNDIPKDSHDFTRYKGLGEMDDHELKDACLTDGFRRIYQVQYPDNIERFNEILGTSWGRSKLLEDLHVLINVNEE